MPAGRRLPLRYSVSTRITRATASAGPSAGPSAKRARTLAEQHPAGSGEVNYTEDRITQVVREQRGRRFAGEMRATSGGEPFRVRFVGIFIDEARFVWSEPNGFVEGRLVGPHTIESCYIRTSRQNTEVACNRLVRRKK